MKYFIASLFVFLFSINCFSQKYSFGGNVGADVTYFPKSDFNYSTIFITIGANGVSSVDKAFLGGGCGFGYNGIEHSNQLSFIAHASYTPKLNDNFEYLIDAKFGPCILFDCKKKIGVFVNVSPIGISIFKHNNISIGYNFIQHNEKNSHGINLSYCYNF